MLKNLYVKDLAIIADLNLEFSSHMTVLTGQTGAGKSLIIDSLSLLLGARADTDMIRYKASKAIIRGVFDLSKDIRNILDEMGISYNDELEIIREIQMSGKSVIKVNDINITLNQLKMISAYLGDIHVQHDTYKLINKETYLSFLDNKTDQKFFNIYKDFQLFKNNYLNALLTYNQASKQNKDLENKLDFLKHQESELRNLALTLNEEEELKEEIIKLKNFDKIYQNINEAYQSLDNEFFQIDAIYDSAQKLSKISSYDEAYQKYHDDLSNCYYVLEEVKSFLFKTKNELDFDPQTLENMETRLYELTKVKEKYRLSIDELIKYYDKIKMEIDLFENYDETLSKLKNEVIKTYELTFKKGLELQNYRKKVALDVEKALIAHAIDLDLENVQFKIEFKDFINDDYLTNHFFENGIDEIDFLISLNKGEPLKPLAKVASGGELSRIMLAFKALFFENISISLLVFDEIDAGISGGTAIKVAKKMHQMAQKTQVLCITHLPQVAACGDHHLYISKKEIDGRTTTEVKYLNNEERISEVAFMLSGLHYNHASILAATELLKH